MCANYLVSIKNLTMRKLFTLCLALLCIGNMLSQAPTLTLLNGYTLTPNTTDTIGAFARIYYHQPRNKFYVTYAARQAGSSQPAGMLSNFAWREYDANMNFTGNKGSLPGFTSAGDYAMIMIDSTYYHLTNLGSTSVGVLKYKLTKMDDNFTSLATQTITLSSHDSNIDQLLNYTNGKLIIGAMYEGSSSPPVTPPTATYSPNVHIYQYDLNLNSIATDIILPQLAYSWGASCIFNAGNYHIITTDNIGSHKLYCYKYDSNFNYLNTTQISNDGQWSQGVLFINGYFFVAHHTGDHNRGNVVIDIYDNNWVAQSTTTVTNFVVATTTNQVSYNCNRPFLTLVGNKLYVSYDIEKYIFPVNQKDWQAGVKVFQINGATGITENNINETFAISPNPSNKEITLSFKEPTTSCEISIIDFTGKQIKTETISNGSLNHQIDISHLSNGVYLCEIKSGTKTVSRKFIKE